MCRKQNLESPWLRQGWGGGVMLSSRWTERTSVTTKHKEQALKGDGVPSCNHRGVPNTRTLINQRLSFNHPPPAIVSWPLRLNKPPFMVSAGWHVSLWLKWQKWANTEIQTGKWAMQLGGHEGQRWWQERETVTGWKKEGEWRSFPFFPLSTSTQSFLQSSVPFL